MTQATRMGIGTAKIMLSNSSRTEEKLAEMIEHWIGVGILIGIGLMLAPLIFDVILALLWPVVKLLV
jgi:hypothetical protein